MPTRHTPAFWNNRSVREVERESIRRYVQEAADAGFLGGRVLDYGCGQQPYRDIVEVAGGEYVGYDRDVYPGAVAPGRQGPEEPFQERWDAILCTQVVQYVHDVPELLYELRLALAPGGALIITWPTTWAEVEPTDLWRFTQSGMRHLLTEVGFRHLHDVTLRAEIDLGGFRLPLGYGAVALQQEPAS